MTTDEELRRLLEDARAMLNRPLPSRRPASQVAEPGISNWTNLDKLIAPIHWAWPGWLPHGFITILAGEPGAGKSLLLTHHLRKGSARPGGRLTQDHLLGAGAIIQTARVIWALDVPDPTTPAHRRLSVIKNNLAPPPQPLGFHITDEGLHFGPPPAPPARAPALDAALHFLRQTLAAGPLPAREIRTRAEAAGIAWRTLKRAKKALAIRSFRPPGEGQWHWQLPEK